MVLHPKNKKSINIDNGYAFYFLNELLRLNRYHILKLWCQLLGATEAPFRGWPIRTTTQDAGNNKNQSHREDNKILRSLTTLLIFMEEKLYCDPFLHYFTCTVWGYMIKLIFVRNSKPNFTQIRSHLDKWLKYLWTLNLFLVTQINWFG